MVIVLPLKPIHFPEFILSTLFNLLFFLFSQHTTVHTNHSPLCMPPGPPLARLRPCRLDLYWAHSHRRWCGRVPARQLSSGAWLRCVRGIMVTASLVLINFTLSITGSYSLLHECVVSEFRVWKFSHIVVWWVQVVKDWINFQQGNSTSKLSLHDKAYLWPQSLNLWRVQTSRLHVTRPTGARGLHIVPPRTSLILKGIHFIFSLKHCWVFFISVCYTFPRQLLL